NILYVRGREMRLHQELVLGVGGARVLRRLGIEPQVWHLNEGHSAFLLCERAREIVATGATLDEAWARVRRNSTFTIHTPVAAGHERFEADLVRRVAGPLLDGDGRPNTGGVPVEDVLELGRGVDANPGQFDMTAFSLRLTCVANAVSELHAHTANATWDGLSPRPILAITNGVHVPSWIGDSQRENATRYLGVELDEMDRLEPKLAERVDRIPRADLWDAHQRQKLELTLFARGRLRNQFARLGESPNDLKDLDQLLDPSFFTIGFARRFATY